MLQPCRCGLMQGSCDCARPEPKPPVTKKPLTPFKAPQPAVPAVPPVNPSTR